MEWFLAGRAPPPKNRARTMRATQGGGVCKSIKGPDDRQQGEKNCKGKGWRGGTAHSCRREAAAGLRAFPMGRHRQREGNSFRGVVLSAGNNMNWLSEAGGDGKGPAGGGAGDNRVRRGLAAAARQAAPQAEPQLVCPRGRPTQQAGRWRGGKAQRGGGWRQVRPVSNLLCAGRSEAEAAGFLVVMLSSGALARARCWFGRSSWGAAS